MRNIKSLLVTTLTVISVVSFVAIPAAITVGVSGCSTSQQRKTVNTIASLGYTVDAAVKSYFDLVVAGKVATNDVPTVAKSYSLFQVAYNTALTVAALNTNAPPSVDLNNAASQTLLTITAAKKK